MSPTQLSLKRMRDAGFMTAVTEKWNHHARIRQDLFGFIDVLAIRGNEVVAIQTTTAANMSARHAKLMALPAVATWAASPNRILVLHGWAKCGPRGKRKTWKCRARRYRTDELGNIEGFYEME